MIANKRCNVGDCNDKLRKTSYKWTEPQSRAKYEECGSTSGN